MKCLNLSNSNTFPWNLNGLEIFKSAGNDITEIHYLPEGLEELDLSRNNITEIENLPDSLRILNLSENNIDIIENLPEELEELRIHYNKLKKLENLPPNLKSLWINGNCITKIENLPKNLLYISIDINEIEDIDFLNFPDSCHNNYHHILFGDAVMKNDPYLPKIHKMKKFVRLVRGIWAINQLKRMFKLKKMLHPDSDYVKNELKGRFEDNQKHFS